VIELVPDGGWHTATTPRVAPDTRGAFAAFVTAVCRAIGRAEPANIMLTLHRNPRIFWPWLLFVSRFLPFGRLAPIDRERIILRVAWNTRCRYEWRQHLELGRRAGLTSDDIARVTRGPDAGWPPRQAALLRACDQLHAHRCIDDTTWRELAGLYGDDDLIELTLLVGHYEMLAGFLNSAGVQLEALPADPR
jgi:4-carboxymuconolactone decarboxylase